jgi:hypothetical protein
VAQHKTMDPGLSDREFLRAKLMVQGKLTHEQVQDALDDDGEAAPLTLQSLDALKARLEGQQQLREDVAELAAVLIDLLDRSIVSGHHERDRIGTLPALRRGAELGEKMREAEERVH